MQSHPRQFFTPITRSHTICVLINITQPRPTHYSHWDEVADARQQVFMGVEGRVCGASSMLRSVFVAVLALASCSAGQTYS